MTSSIMENYDWRKEAAGSLNDDDVELAFMRQAFTHIESKARPLLRDPFFLGFEVVEKNDANTNIVGLFVFRLDETLLYAPAFFKNGAIKGANLLYDTNLKLFSPLVPEWCNYYVGKYGEDTGKSVQEGKINSSSKDINFENLKLPNSLRKTASLQSIEYWGEMKKQAKAGGEKLLPKFLKQTGLQGFKKLANTIEDNYEFADAINTVYEPGEWLELDLEDNFKKEAAITEPMTLQIHVGDFNPNAEVSLDEQHVYGFSYEDKRKDHVEVYEDRPEVGEQLVNSGVAKVLDNGGDWKELVVVMGVKTRNVIDNTVSDPVPSMAFGDDEVGGYAVSSNSFAEAGYNVGHSYEENTKTRKCLVDLENKKYCYTYAPLYGKMVEDKSISSEGVSPKDLQEGKTYKLMSGRNVSMDLLKVVSKNIDDEIVTLKADTPYYLGETKIKINTELGTDFDEDLKVWGKDTVGFELTGESTDYIDNQDYTFDFIPGDEHTLMDFLSDNDVKRTTVKKASATKYYIDYNGSRTFEMDKIATSNALARDLGIEGNLARNLVVDADKQGERNFLVKSAITRLDSSPQLRDTMTIDPVMGVRQDAPESHVISTTNDAPEHVEGQTGDQYTMDGMDVLIETGTPEQLYEASKEVQDDTLFDMGVVGSLVKTFDSAEMVEQFMPDLRQGLDKLGRIIFLINWKPEDFVEAYGSDDIGDMENKLVSSFKQFGDLTLDLMQQFSYEDKVDMNALSK